MSGSSSAAATAASAPAGPRDINSVLTSKGLRFQIKTGGAKYECQLHADRASYERIKSTRSSSADSVNSASSTRSH